MKLFGKNPVIERLRTNPQSIRKISMEQGYKDADIIRKKAKQWSIPIYDMPKHKMDKISRNKNSQGIFIDIDDYEYKTYAEVLDRAVNKKRTIVFLDRLTDPQNFGAILRSLGCLGHYSVVLPQKDSVKVTEAVLRVASGGDNQVEVAQVSNLNKAIRQAKERGFNIVGSIVGAGESIYDVIFPHPVALVIGSEQKGVRDVVRKELDLEITIPMHIDTLSLNAAQATSIICYEITKQKTNYKKQK